MPAKSFGASYARDAQPACPVPPRAASATWGRLAQLASVTRGFLTRHCGAVMCCRDEPENSVIRTRDGMRDARGARGGADPRDDPRWRKRRRLSQMEVDDAGFEEDARRNATVSDRCHDCAA